jgi:hypothetical protein
MTDGALGPSLGVSASAAMAGMASDLQTGSGAIAASTVMISSGCWDRRRPRRSVRSGTAWSIRGLSLPGADPDEVRTVTSEARRGDSGPGCQRPTRGYRHRNLLPTGVQATDQRTLVHHLYDEDDNESGEDDAVGDQRNETRTPTTCLGAANVNLWRLVDLSRLRPRHVD